MWSFSIGSNGTTVRSMAASAAGNGQFAIEGASSGTADLDPGATIDPVYGDIIPAPHPVAFRRETSASVLARRQT